MTKQEMQQQALSNAVQNQSVMNYASIFNGFMARGIAEADIQPRENVFTYNAWVALGRQVRKGEHGVKVVTFVPMSVRDKDTDEKKKIGRRPRTTTVFHVSQTEPIPTHPFIITCPCESCTLELQRQNKELQHDATDENVPFAGE